MDDAGESENAKKDTTGGGKKGSRANEQKDGKESKKGGKADRQKGAPKAKDAQPSWVKKAEVDGEEEAQKPQEKKGRAEKAKEKGEKGEKGQGRGEGGNKNPAKESWKERRGKHHQERYDGDAAATGGDEPQAGAGGKGGRHRGKGDAGKGEALNGGNLLSMLKANPPSIIRFTREELLSIGQLPASKVKPQGMHVIIDKENKESTLVLRHKAEKDGEYDEERERERRERRERRELRADTRSRQEGAEEERQKALAVPEDDRGEQPPRNSRWGTERGWKEGEQQQQQQQQQLQQQHQQQQQQQLSQQQMQMQQGKGKGKDYGGVDGKGQNWQAQNEWAMPQGKQVGAGANDWAMPSKSASGRGDDWDMPDENSSTGNFFDFTLGDIRQAEESLNKGVSMADYKKSLASSRADQQPLEPVEEVAKEKGAGGKERGSSDGMFGGDSFFACEEEEDVAQASRGFGKWFSRSKDQEVEDGDDDEPGWDMPAPSRGTGSMTQATATFPQDKSKPSPSASSRPEPRSPSGQNLNLIERLLEDSPVSKHNETDASFRMGNAGQNALVGKSIASMLGREHEAGEAAAAASAGAGVDPSKQGKLSVAELFQLAQGKEMPSMPVTSSKNKEGNGEETEEQRMQREVLKMTSHLMWLASGKGGQAGMPPGSRFPGYQPPGYGAGGFGMPGMEGRGTPQEHAEAYAQAQAMMGMAGGAFPAAGKGAKGAQASWPAAMGAGYPYARGPGYGTQYPGYGTPDYSQMSAGAAGFGSTAQAAAMHGMYSGLGAGVPAGPRPAAAKASASSPEKAATGRGGGLGGGASLFGSAGQASSWLDSGNGGYGAAPAPGATLTQAASLSATQAASLGPAFAAPAATAPGSAPKAREQAFRDFRDGKSDKGPSAGLLEGAAGHLAASPSLEEAANDEDSGCSQS